MNAAGLSLALVTLSSPALATSATRLAYEAPAGCPTEPEFVAAVATRGADFGATEALKPDRIMVVSIRRQADEFAGAFQVRDGQGSTNKREVRAPTCAGVADALAVVTAIALRPEATGESATGPAPAPTPASDPPAPPAKPTAPPPDATAPPPPDIRLYGKTRIFPPRADSVQVRAGTLRFDLERSATLYAGATSGLAPSVLLPRYDLSFVLAPFVTTPEGAQRIHGLVFELRVSALGKGTYSSPDTKTDLFGLAFGIDVCQSPHYDSRGLVLLFCGEYGGGVASLTTRGMDGTQIQSKESGFGVVSLGGEAQYTFGRLFHIGVKLGGGFTVGQVTAERADGSRIFTSSLWSAYALLGAGLRY